MPTKVTAPSDDAIRTRAYLMWEADGRPFGNDSHYWDLAFTELSTPARPKRAAASSTAPEKKAKVVAKPAAKARKPAAKTAAKPKKK
jgi:hypothetical protein